MARKIFMNVAEGDECRIAVLEDGKLFEYFVDRPSQLKHVGNIYKGLISNIEPGIQAAFVDVGLERNGFLHVSDIDYAYEKSPDLKDLFSRTLRIKESVSEDAILTTSEDRDVEEVEQFAASEPAASNGQEPKDPAKDPEEAQFLETLNGETAGHRITESPLNVDPAHKSPAETQTEDQPATQPPRPEGDRKRRRRRRRKRGGQAHGNGSPPPAAGEGAAASAGKSPEAAPAGESTPKPETTADKPPSDKPPQDSPQAGAEAAKPAAPKRSRRRRTPKKRGGHLPKRVLEGDEKPQPDATGTRDIDGKPTDGGDGGTPGPQYRYNRGQQPKIQGLLKRGQEVVIQVTKASQGGKGPGLSTFVSLPGRYMVLTPTSNRGGVSRKIEDGSARSELRKMLDKLPVPEGMGVIIRTAAIDRSYDELLRDLNYLLRVWSVIVERIHEAPAPALLYSDSDPAIRAVRDYFTADTQEIVIDNPDVFARVVSFFDQLMPSFRDRVKLYEGSTPLFFDIGLESQVERIFDKKVTLKSGGYLFIEQTEALISIDVNSGKFTGGGDAEKTAYLTNMEAIPEICRQLRLRDLAGIVCCDFIDMMNSRHRHDVENALKRELRKDRARTKVARFSPFGVIEMTRQRVRPSIKAYTFVSCPTCGGFGMVSSAETMCLSLIRRIKLALIEDRVHELAVQVHPHVLSHLHSEFREDMDELEDRFNKRIVFEYARDLELGQTRMFAVNDRGVRVLFDIDQRISSLANSPATVSKASAPLPPAASGAASPQAGPKAAGADPGRRRKRRGGRRQREREQERMDRDKRIREQAGKAVNFGDTLPDAPKIEVIREPERKVARDSRRRRGSRPAKEKLESTDATTKQPKKEPAAQPNVSSAKEMAAPGPEKVEAGGQATGVVETSVEGESDMAKKTAKKAARKPAKKKAAKKPAKKKPAKKAAKKKPARKAAKKKTAKKPAKKAAKKKPAKKAAKKKPAKRRPARRAGSSDE